MTESFLPEEFLTSPDRMPAFLTRYGTDRDLLERRYTAPWSPHRRERLRQFLSGWREALGALPFTDLTRSDRADWLLFRRLLDAETRRLDQEAADYAEMEPLLPFVLALLALEDERRQLDETPAENIADTLDSALNHARRAINAWQESVSPPPVRSSVVRRAAKLLDQLRDLLRGWFGFRHGYDPLFTWWVETPYRALDQVLEEYAALLRAHSADPEDVIGEPLGRDALVTSIEYAQIADTPEELIALAVQERDWCLEEMRNAARDLGHGDDWRAALEQVKSEHLPPGAQPALVRDLAWEALAYVEENDLVTVPPLARECWRMEMMSAEAQKVNPFFLGGETIIVSFPVSAMSYVEKRMSLRGNNPAFARATVHHELIPGHHLQLFYQERYRPYRRLFQTPFWTEGWTLHWEMLLWERGFARTPQERIGMLFWRLHRAARVLFSLSFHLGQMTPAECVEMLVQDVGHERANAVAEVRRSFAGDYDPLYQCAYLLGGLQVHALHRELTASGQMSDRQFHDAFLRENCLPIATLRALLCDLPLEQDSQIAWHFAHG